METTVINTPPASTKEKSGEFIAGLVALIVLLVVLLVLGGWLFKIRLLTSGLSTWATVKPNTALGFFLTGWALWLLRRKKFPAVLSQSARGLGQGAAAAAAVLGLLTLAEYLLGLNFGIDQLVLKDGWTDPQLAAPGRMSVATAAAFVFLGGALFFLGHGGSRATLTSQTLALFTLIDAVIGGGGYLFGVRGLYAVSFYSSMAIPTALLFILVSLGVLSNRVEQGLMATFSSSRGEGYMARKILPLAVIGPFLMAWLSLQGEQAGFYGPEFGLVLFATITVIIFSGLVWFGAKSWTSFDTKRQAALEEQRRVHAQLAAIVEFSSSAIISKNLDGIILSWNPGAERIFGFKAEEMIGTSFLRLIRPEQKEEEEQMLNQLRQGESADYAEMVLLGKNGRPIEVDVITSPIKDEMGRVIGASKVLRDISENMRVANTLEVRTFELMESELRYRFLADTLPQIIWSAQSDGSVGYYNQRWFDYTGMTLAETKDWGWKPVIHPIDLPNCLHRWNRSIRTGCNYEVEYRFRRGSDKSYRWHLGRAFPMRNAQGEIVQWVGTCTDIEDQKQAQVVLEKSVRERTLELMAAKARLQSVLDAATQVSVIATDLDGLITVFNSGAEQLLGYAAEEVVGRLFLVSLHLESELLARGVELSESAGRTISGFAAFADQAWQGTPEEREWTYVRKDGSRLMVNVIVTRLVGPDGDSNGFLAMATNISDRKVAEKRLRDQALILDLVNETVLVCNVQDEIIYWNQEAQKVYGWRTEEVLGQVVRNLLKTKFPLPLEEIKKRLLTDGHWSGELEHSRRDGSRLTMLSRWTLQRDQADQPLAIIQMNHDITARKKSERELQESKERLNAILNSSLDGVIAYESIRNKKGELKDFSFALINPAAEKMLQKEAHTLIGQSLLENFPTIHSDGLFQRFGQIVDDGRSQDFEHVSLRGDEPRWYRIAGVRLGDGLVISYSEITARKCYEAQLQQAKERAELADRAKSEFLANMSHEIRTPMNGIIGFSEFLASGKPGPLNEKQSEYLEDILNSGRHLLHLINSLLDLARVEAGRMELQIESFSLRHSIAEVCAVTQPMAQQRGIKVSTKFAVNLDKVTLDPQKFRQILYNLISNAIKFSPDGGKVEVTAYLEGTDQFAIKVKDHGIGIKAEDIKRLFKDFEQLDSSSTRRYQGSGLGLSLTRRIVELQKGQITVKSEFGVGSSFTVILPITLPIDRSS